MKAQHGGEPRAAKSGGGEEPEFHPRTRSPCAQTDHIPTSQALLVVGLLKGRTGFYKSLHFHHLALRLDQRCHFSIASNDSSQYESPSMPPLIKHQVLPWFASKRFVYVPTLSLCCEILRSRHLILLTSVSQPGKEDRMSHGRKVRRINLEMFRKQQKSQQQEV